MCVCVCSLCSGNPIGSTILYCVCGFKLQALPRDLFPIPDTSAAWFAGLSQRKESRRNRAGSVRAVRNRRKRTIKSRARLRQAFNQCNGRRGPQPGRMAQRNGMYIYIYLEVVHTTHPHPDTP